MNYWWVSQNQTHKQEIGVGYMWSPKADKNGKPVQSYTNMTKVSVGDLVFAFYQSKIQSIGTVLHPAVTSPKPEEFGSSGDYWSNSRWMVAVSWTALPNPMSPKEHIETLIPFLPQKHSPIRKDGRGKSDPVAEFIRECVTTEGGDIFHTVAELISLARKYMIREDMTIPDEVAIRKSLVRMLGETKQHRTENGRVRGYFGLKVSMPEDDDVPF